jgi:hypothetical protein
MTLTINVFLHTVWQAKKRQVVLDESYVSAVSELRLVLSPSDHRKTDKSSQFREFVLSELTANAF